MPRLNQARVLEELEFVYVPMTKGEREKLRVDVGQGRSGRHLWMRDVNPGQWRIVEAPDQDRILERGRGGVTGVLAHDTDEAIVHFLEREIRNRKLRSEAFDYMRGMHLLLPVIEALPSANLNAISRTDWLECAKSLEDSLDELGLISSLYCIANASEALRQVRWAASCRAIVEAGGIASLATIFHPNCSLSASDIEMLAEQSGTKIRGVLREQRAMHEELVDPPLLGF